MQCAIWNTRDNLKMIDLTSSPHVLGKDVTLRVLDNQNQKFKSVVFEVTGALVHKQVSSTAPFYLFGDDGNKPIGRELSAGIYYVKITCYDEVNGKGNVIDVQTTSFVVNEPPPTFVPKITLLHSVLPAGHAVHVHACDSVLPKGVNIVDVRFEWDFKDPGSSYNELVGFNAAHIYVGGGARTVRLRATLPNGTAKTTHATIQLEPYTRKVVHLGANSTTTLEQELAAAPTGRLEIVLAGGVTYRLSSNDASLDLRGRSDVVIRAESGSTANPPVIFHPDPAPNAIKSLFTFDSNSQHVTIDGVIFESAYKGESRNCTRVGHPSGSNITFRSCRLRAMDGFNLNSKPGGVLLQNNRAEGDISIRHYFSWTEGSDLVFLGNQCKNSVTEHIVRLLNPTRVLFHGNWFANIDRRVDDPSRTDDTINPGDLAKGVFVIQASELVYLHLNLTSAGPSGTGPLGAVDKSTVDGKLVLKPIGTPSDRTSLAVFDQNMFVNGTVTAGHGSEHVRFRNNLVIWEKSGDGMVVEPRSNVYERDCLDVVFENNTILLNSDSGNGIRVGDNNRGVTVRKNLVIGKDVKFGLRWSSAVTAVTNASYRFDGNVYPSPAGGVAYARGGANVIDGKYVTPDEWNQASIVGTDRFLDVTLNGDILSYEGAGAPAIKINFEE